MKLGQYTGQEWKIIKADFGKETNLEIDELSYLKENTVGSRHLIEE